MIVLNRNFSFEKDTYGWQLHQWRDGVNKSNEPTRYKTTTYHANLEQVIDAIINWSAGRCNTVDELKTLLTTAVTELTALLEKAMATNPSNQENT